MAKEHPPSPRKAKKAQKRKNKVLSKADTVDEKDCILQTDINTRDCRLLYASAKTVHCALNLSCIPCAYKVGCFDVALDTEFRKNIPNQRPEQCPRIINAGVQSSSAMGYKQGMSVLTVGDGDFSFSLAIARMLSPQTIENGIVATSYESRETLQKVYPDLDQSVVELEALNTTVCFEVDATRLAETLPDHVTRIKGRRRKFHRIVWNFPCTAAPLGQDGQNQAMESNKELIRRFIANCRQLLHNDGEIHMCHKTKPPYNQWKLEEIVSQAFYEYKDCSSHFTGRIVLDRALLPPYTPRKALDRKSFPCHDACFYVFQIHRSPSGDKTLLESSREEEGGYPRTIPSNSSEIDPSNIDNVAVDIMPVTEELVRDIRSKHLATHLTRPHKQRKTRKMYAGHKRHRQFS